MTADRNKPGVAFWATVALVVSLAGYPLSIGPATWLNCRLNSPSFSQGAYHVYRPLALACYQSVTAQGAVLTYAYRWTPSEFKFVRSGRVRLPPGFTLFELLDK